LGILITKVGNIIIYKHDSKTLKLVHKFILLYRFKTWAFACGRRGLVNNINVNPENHRLCAAHFDNEMFTNSQKSRLRLDATPKKQLARYFVDFQSD
jgi:hypothetical protein